jgi:hypothetical protein
MAEPRTTKHSVVGTVRWLPPSPMKKGGPIKLLDNWDEKNITAVMIRQLAGVPTYGGRFSGKVPWYKPAAGQLRRAWEEIEERGLLSRVLFWGGSFVPRLIRGSTHTPSNHAFGTAFDINVRWNGLGVTPPPAGMRGSVRELVPTFEKHGFGWGGNYTRRPDGMHFELERLGPPQGGAAPVAVEVFVNGAQEVLPALLIDSRTWIGARAFTQRLGGRITAVHESPFRVTVQVDGRERVLSGKNIGGTGYVAFHRLIPLYGLKYEYSSARKRLDITT